MNYLVYDEIHLQTQGDMVFDQEVLFGELSMLSLEQAGENAGQRTLPIFNSVSLTPDHYEKFWQWTKKWAEKGLKYLNVDVLSYGVQLPYWSLEVLTQTMFK